MALRSINSVSRSPLIVCSLAVFAALVGAAPKANAAFHLWQIKEAFSNADGSVQFIEMFDPSPGENSVGGLLLVANSDEDPNAYEFPDDIPFTKSTDHKHLLIATPGFATLAGGVTPDFFLPDPAVEGHPFFNPSASNISITFGGSGDTISFAGATLPWTGAHSVTDTLLVFGSQNLVFGVNSPTNIDDGAGSINVAPPPTGDYNYNHAVDAADYVVWREMRNQSGIPLRTLADGTGNGTIDSSDYTFWRGRFGNAAGSGSSSVPEPAVATAGLEMIILMLGSFRRRNQKFDHSEQ